MYKEYTDNIREKSQATRIGMAPCRQWQGGYFLPSKNLYTYKGPIHIRLGPAYHTQT